MFKLILADPPWPYDDPGVRGGTDLHYENLSVADIAGMRVQDLADRHCVLALWITRPMADEGRIVLQRWGFRHYGELFTWVKFDTKGDPWLGNGRYTRANSEGCLLGIRGRGIERQDAGVSQLIDTYGPRKDHSYKPEESYRRLEQLFGDVSRLELFARRQRPGWTTWGNEVPSDPSITKTLFPGRT